jgi:hypothetical protein
MMPTAAEQEHEGTPTAVTTATIAATSIEGDGPNVVAEVDTVVPQVACRPGDTLVGHLLNHVPKVPT